MQSLIADHREPLLCHWPRSLRRPYSGRGSVLRRTPRWRVWIRTFCSTLDRKGFRGFFRVILGPIYRCAGHPIGCRLRCTDRVIGRWSEEPPRTVRISRGQIKAALSAMRAHRGTEGSNPVRSSGESTSESSAPLPRRLHWPQWPVVVRKAPVRKPVTCANGYRAGCG